MRSKISKIEKTKNILIVVLIISAILLLYFLWENDTFNSVRTPIDIISDIQKPQISNPADLIVPEIISVNPGTSNYKYKCSDGRTDEYWKEFIGKFKQFSMSENMFIEEIKKEQWDQAEGYTSIKADFAYEISLTNLCDIFAINQPSIYNTIEIVSSILYSEGSKESIIIFDQKNDKYYRLAVSQNIGLFSELIEEIKNREAGDYSPMTSLFNVDNDCLIPLSESMNIQSLYFETEVEEEGDKKVREIAQLFFGENFDFIRRIKDTNNTTVFMYGYSEKVLTCSQDGSFEYKEEFSGGTSQESLYNSLRICTEYIDNHGEFKDAKSQSVTPYLRDVILIERDKRKGYRFTFGVKIDGVPVYYNAQDAFIIEIIGSQVTYYKRTAISYEEPDSHENSYTDIMTASNVLLMNYDGSIKDIFTQNGIEVIEKTRKNEEDIDDFDIVSGNIDTIKVGYLKSDEEKVLLPIWVFRAGSIDMYFDIYSGETLGYTAK